MGCTSATREIASNIEREKTLKKIIKQTANLKKEQYRIVDEDGMVLLKRQGINDRVEMTVGEKREFMDGNSSIHNHPNEFNLGGTFSESDFSDFGYGARQVIVSAPEGEYRMINTEFGKKNQYEGWKKLEEGARKIADSTNSTKIYSEANKIMEKSSISKKLTKASADWVSRKKAGASREELSNLADKVNELQKQYSTELKKTRRMLEVKPYHEYYKKNASKYGFKYVYPKDVY